MSTPVPGAAEGLVVLAIVVVVAAFLRWWNGQ